MAGSIEGFTLNSLRDRVGGEVSGDGTVVVRRIAEIAQGGAGDIVLLKSAKYRKLIAESRASAIVTNSEFASDVSIPALISPNPALTFAKLASILHPDPRPAPGIHASAIVEEGAEVDSTATIGAFSFIAAGAIVGADAIVGPASIVGKGCRLGAGCHLVARVTLCKNVVLGLRCIVHPGAVIGSDGFGNVLDQGVWRKIPQLGGVILGDDVEIGANTTIDCGAIGDTVIEDGVKIDNLVHIAHNVHVGAHTAIAANTGIAGSTRIGKHCMVAGAVGISGHLEIVDNVHFTGMSMVTKSIRESGVYSSGIPAEKNDVWRRNVARYRQLEKLSERLRRLEEHLNLDTKGPEIG